MTGNPYYTALVRVDRAGARGAAERPALSGHAGAVMIPTIERTAFEYIVGPLVMSFNQGVPAEMILLLSVPAGAELTPRNTS